MVQSLERCLRRLGMEYVDLLWLHMWVFMLFDQIELALSLPRVGMVDGGAPGGGA